jgi:hypothetical protein
MIIKLKSGHMINTDMVLFISPANPREPGNPACMIRFKDGDTLFTSDTPREVSKALKGQEGGGEERWQ